MIGLLDLIGFALGGAIMITMAIGIALSAFMPALDRWSKRYFIALFSLMFMCSVSCFLALVFWYDPSMAQAARIVYFTEGLFLATPIFMPMLFILHYSGEKIKNSPLFWLVTSILGVYFVVHIVTQFTDVFYYVTPDNQFIRGPLWAFWVFPFAVCMVLNTTGLFYRVKKIPKSILSLFLSICFI